MAVYPEGMPCWADAMFSDVEGAKAFYGEVLGWTFGEASSEFGYYTQAYSDGKAVAAVVPPMPGQEGHSAWCLYLASPDVAATAGKIRSAGGEVLMEPMKVGDFGSMMIAADPGGVVFGVWQGGDHQGFEKRGEPGSYAWGEVFTRQPAKANAFFPQVFPYRSRKVVDEKADYTVHQVGEEPALGCMEMTPDVPADVPSFLSVYFAVDGCDAAVERATSAGGTLVFGPMDSPFGRMASLVDPQGAAFSVIDPADTVGEMPETVEA